jgi:hypothetical protein
VALVRGGVEVASSPLVLSGPPDLAIMDVLARLQLVARRHGCSVRVSGACADLVELLDLVGLRELLTGEGLGIEAGRQPEGGEQARVQEVVEPGDPVA